MASCSNCGAKLVEGSALCGSCGLPCGSSTAPGPPPPGPGAAFATIEGILAALIARVQNILTKPQEEWPVIQQEQTNIAALYRSYIALLAAIPLIADFIDRCIIGTAVLFATFRFPLVRGLIGFILIYAFTLGGVYLAAYAIAKLAPIFGSQSRFLQALKLVTYSYTAYWVAGIGFVVPIVGWLVVLAGIVYGVYLFYLGLPVMMKTPQDKVILYTIVAWLVLTAITFIPTMAVRRYVFGEVVALTGF